MSQNTNQTSCPACNGQDFDEEFDEFDAVCDNCGFVIHDKSSTYELEHTPFADDSNQTNKKDWLSFCQVTNATEKRIAIAFDHLEEIANRFEINDQVRLEAADLYCDGMRLGLTDGRDTKCFVTACVRLASLKHSEPIPIDRLISDEDVEGEKFRASRLTLEDELEMKIEAQPPSSYITFIKNELSISESAITEADKILNEQIESEDLAGKNPAGIAAAAVYLGSNVTQKEVGDAVGLSSETIRKRADDLKF